MYMFVLYSTNMYRYIHALFNMCTKCNTICTGTGAVCQTSISSEP